LNTVGVTETGKDGVDSLTGHPTGLSSPVGTVAYMSPEQVRGEEIAPRSDIFSLGVVLYEMAGGKRAFEGGSSADTMNAILQEDPPELPRSVSPALNQIVRRCIEKQPARRFQSAADLGSALQALLLAREHRGLQKRGRWVPWVDAALIGALLALPIGFYFNSKPLPLPGVQFSIYAPEGLTFGRIRYEGPPLVSPDGSMIAFGGRKADGAIQIWVRRIDSLTAKPLGGTEGAMYPFWSPDSRSLAFFAGGDLKKVDLNGGSPIALAAAPGGGGGGGKGRGGAWAQRGGAVGTILFASNKGFLVQVPSSGGTPTPVTTLDPAHPEVRHAQPQFLPDGHHFLYLEVDAGETSLYVGDIEAKPQLRNGRRLMAAEGKVWWAPPGYLLFLRDNDLVAQSFDSRRFELGGNPFLVAEHLANGTNRWTSDFSVSSNGVLVWRGGFNSRPQLVWLDRSGRQIGSEEIRQPLWSPRLSPDGKRIALTGPVVNSLGITPPPGSHVWLWSLSPGVASPVTMADAFDASPIWSPDGRQIVFSRRQGSDYGIYIKGRTTESTSRVGLRNLHQGCRRIRKRGIAAQDGGSLMAHLLVSRRKLHLVIRC
jgi:eukaryotic-like serine/threonine-protein kinase